MNPFNEFLNKMKEMGLPLIWLKDPIRQRPSVSLTLLVISFSFTMLGLVGILKIDVELAKEVLWGTSLLYFGRSIGFKDSKVLESTTVKKEE